MGECLRQLEWGVWWRRGSSKISDVCKGYYYSIMRTICIVITVLLYGSSCLSWGDTSIPLNSAIYQGDDIQIRFYLPDSPPKITIYAKLKSYCFFGILLSDVMVKGDFHIAEVINDTFSLTDAYNYGNHTAPKPDITNSLTLLGYDTDQSTYLTVKYERLLDTGDSEDTVLVRGSTIKLSYAYRPGSKKLTYHQSNHNTITGTVQNNSILSMSGGTPNYRLIHGIIETVVWCLLVDIAVWFKYLYSNPDRLKIHSLMMLVCVLITLSTTSMMIITQNPNFSQINDSTKAHFALGLTMIVWILIQVFQGLAGRIATLNPQTSPAIVIKMRKVHRYMGYPIIFIGKTNVIIGWIMYDVQMAVWVVCSEIVIITILFLCFRVKTAGIMTSDVSEKIEVPKTALSEQLARLVEKPYPCEQVQQKKFVIFDDKIFMIPQMAFHPGGQNIIVLVNGRQVDRFLYGMQHLELYPQLMPNQHPKQALQLVFEPVGRLPPNPLVRFTDNIFQVKSIISLSINLSIFYYHLKIGHTIYRPIQNLRHIGQYFSVLAFGKTRLYSLVYSMRRQNLEMKGDLLSRIVPKEKMLFVRTRSLNYINKKYIDEEMSVEDLTSAARTKFAEQTLPLVIKRRAEPTAISRLLYMDLQAPVVIHGPKGRGFCLEALPPGQIVIVAFDEGIIRFLDLFDLMFKALIKIPSTFRIQQKQIELGRRLLESHSFHIILRTTSINQLIVPDQLNLICELESPQVHINVHVAESLPPWAFRNCQLKTEVNADTLCRLLQGRRSVQMVYMACPTQVCKPLTKGLWDVGIENDRIFFV